MIRRPRLSATPVVLAITLFVCAPAASGTPRHGPLSTASATVPPIALALATVTGRASAEPPVRLSLDEALDRGLAASRRLAGLRARERGARAAVAGRDAADRPQVTAIAGYTRTNHVDEFGIPQPNGALRVIYPDIPDNLRARLDLQWPIYTAGRIDALARAASAELEASGRDLEAARADLRLEITRAFWAAVTASESAGVVEESLRRVDAHLADVRARQAVGLVPPSDVLTVEAQRSRQAMLRIEAEHTRDLALADLRRLAGLAPEVALVLDARLEAPKPAGADAAALVTEAREARPERQALERRIAAAGEQRAAAAAGTKPMVLFGAGVDYARPNPRIFPRLEAWRTSWDVGVNVSWTLWDGGRVKADLAAATAAREALAERLGEFDNVLEVEVRQRRLDLESAAAAIAAATDGERAAAEARRVLGERFANGVATSTEVLDAQVALLQARLDRTRALANARLAAARLARALGQ